MFNWSEVHFSEVASYKIHILNAHTFPQHIYELFEEIHMKICKLKKNENLILENIKTQSDCSM